MKFSLCVPFIIAVLAAGFPRFAQADAPTESTIISSELCTRLWIVELIWAPEGRDPQKLVAVFDTGATSTFIDPDALERISGRRLSEGQRARMKDMTVAGKSFRTFRPEVQDLDHLSRALGRPLDVFLPFQTFAGYLLILDYPAREMLIRKGELPKPDNRIVFNAKGRDDRPWHEIKVGGVKRRLLIDSGSSGGITVAPHRKFDWLSDPFPLRLSQGMFDIDLKEVGRLDGQAQVGSLTFEQPLIALTGDTELLGAQVLKHFVLTFDQKNRRVKMEPATQGPVRMESHRGTGVILRPRPESFEIAQVIKGSPADEAGLEKGDRVTHLDGVPVLDRGCRDFDFQPEESTLLRLQRGARTWEVRVANVVLVP